MAIFPKFREFQHILPCQAQVYQSFFRNANKSIIHGSTNYWVPDASVVGAGVVGCRVGTLASPMVRCKRLCKLS